MEYMRGIVFTGGHGPESGMCRDLAQEADIIVAADSGLDLVEKAGITPAFIIGDMDSINDPERLKKYPSEIILSYPHDKDFTDTELAINFLWEKGCNQVWIAGGGGGRSDHLLAIYSLFERELSPDRWITDVEDIICLNQDSKIQQQIKPGGIVSIFPLGLGPWELQHTGLKWPPPCHEWQQGSFGISNLTETGNFSLHSVKG
jgi:thiamine pyrophosphokinase